MDQTIKKILLVDDDELLVESLKFALERKGYEITVAKDGREAFSVLRQAAPDVIVLDIFMPEMDGLEVLTQLHQEHPDIPIYVISGGGAKELYEFLKVSEHLGAAGSLRKPFTASTLIELIERPPAKRRQSQ